MKKKILTFGLVAVVAVGSLFAQTIDTETVPLTDSNGQGRHCVGSGWECYEVYITGDLIEIHRLSGTPEACDP